MRVKKMKVVNGRFMVIGESDGSILMMSLECFTKHFEPIGENLYRQRRKNDVAPGATAQTSRSRSQGQGYAETQV